MDENEKVPQKCECLERCPICICAAQKAAAQGKNIRFPVCLEHPRLVPPEKKHLCMFAKYAGHPVGKAFCDICNKPIPGTTFLVNLHPEPKPNIDGMYVCSSCIRKDPILKKKAKL